jgi:acyl-CoA thioester hydrolase
MSAPALQTGVVALWLPVQWGEMDAYRHVNNAVYFRWFESARIAYFERIGWPALERETGVGPILHSTQARFRAPVEFPDRVLAEASVSELGADRFTMLYRVTSERLGRVAAEGWGVVVAYDYRAARKCELPAAVRAAIAALEASRPRDGRS